MAKLPNNSWIKVTNTHNVRTKDNEVSKIIFIDNLNNDMDEI